MANPKHLELLKQGVAAWNAWRNESRQTTQSDFRRATPRKVDLSRADLFGVDLSGVDLRGANLHQALLSQSVLVEAQLANADLRGAALQGAILQGANLTRANLRGADLSMADLMNAVLVETNLESANLTSCRVFGISAWKLNLHGANQSNLVITPPNEPTITVDNLEIAQFTYLLLNNEKVREAISTITTKSVLILGRFSSKRKVILDAIREELRKRNYLPILFDLERPSSRDITERLITLASLARFIIADLTNAKAIPQELQAIVPILSVPIQLLVEGSESEYSMFLDFRRYPWVLPVFRYENLDDLCLALGEVVIARVEAKASELESIKKETIT